MNIRMRKRTFPVAALEKDRAELFRCLDFWERGCRNIYLVSGDGTFTGDAIQREGIRAGFREKEGSMSWMPVLSAVGSLSLEAFHRLSREEQAAKLKELLEKFPGQDEFPLLDARGRIASVIEKELPDIHINWAVAPIPEEFRSCGRIYLSSLGNDDLLGFYLRYRSELPMEVLGEENLTKAIHGEGLLVFGEDCFPDCRKRSLLDAVKEQVRIDREKSMAAKEAARRKTEEEERKKREEAEKQREKEIKGILPIVRIAKEWASVREDQLTDTSRLIEKFDEGYHSVSILDREGKFLRIVNLYHFREDFPKKEYRSWRDLYVEQEDDEDRLKWKLAGLFLGTPRKEIPILRDGKIVALGRKSFYFDTEGRWEGIQVLRFRWEWIDEGVAKEFFLNRRRILLSSEHGFLKGFRDAFGSWLDITVYEDCLLGSAMTGDYDLMVCGADLYQAFPMERWEAHRLFFMLLAETVRRWLAQRGVAMHFVFSHGKVPNLEHRVDRQGELIGGSQDFLRDGAITYFISDGSDYDRILEAEKRLPNFHSGRRCTLEAHSYSGNGIYFFGPCIAVGFSSYDPDKSIESFLQRKLNDAKQYYHVINCGNEGLGEDSHIISCLYRLMDTPFRSGDLAVVVINQFYLWGQDARYMPSNCTRMASLLAEHQEMNCFSDPRIGHLNITGNEILADSIFKAIQKDLRNRNRIEDTRHSFFSVHSLPLKETSPLGRWLKELPKATSWDKKEIGSIVLKAYPVTRGDVSLMEEALKRCDFLYIFMLEAAPDSLPSTDVFQKFLEEYAKNRPATVIPPLGTYVN